MDMDNIATVTFLVYLIMFTLHFPRRTSKVFLSLNFSFPCQVRE